MDGIHAIVNKTFGTVNQSVSEMMQGTDTNELLELTLNNQPTMFGMVCFILFIIDVILKL
jgi:hypothetical protein